MIHHNRLNSGADGTGVVVVAVLLLVLTAPMLPALAVGPTGSDLLVDDYHSGSWKLFSPAIAQDADGNFVVVWESHISPGTDDSENSIQGRRFTAAGTPLGSQFQINSYETNQQSGPDIAMNASGEFVVVWTSVGSSGTDVSETSIQGQRFSAAGVPEGPEFQVNSYTDDAQYGASVAMHDDGSFVVVWTSVGSFGDDVYDTSVQGQRYRADGTPLGGQFQINTYIAVSAQGPDVAATPGGAFVVVWVSFGSPQGDPYYSIQGRLYDSAGVPVAAQRQVNSYVLAREYAPAVAADAAGNFAVVWHSDESPEDDSSGMSVQGRLYAFNGLPLGQQAQVNTHNFSDQHFADVAVSDDSSFVVVWISDTSPGDDNDAWSIQGRAYGSDGVPEGSQFQVNSLIDRAQTSPAIASDGSGEYMVTWLTGAHAYVRGLSDRVFADSFESS